MRLRIYGMNVGCLVLFRFLRNRFARPFMQHPWSITRLTRHRGSARNRSPFFRFVPFAIAKWVRGPHRRSTGRSHDSVLTFPSRRSGLTRRLTRAPLLASTVYPRTQCTWRTSGVFL